MKLFLSSYKPSLFAGVYLATFIAVPLGRFWAGDGYNWTLLGGIMLVVLFTAAAAEWRAYDQLGTSFNAWMNSAASTALFAAIPLASAATVSAAYNQLRTPYYKYGDPFLVTNSQPVQHMGTNGELYWVDAAGQDVTTVAFTLATTALLYLVASFAGIALGLAATSHRIGVTVLGVVAAGIGYAFTYKLIHQAYTHYDFETGAVWITESANVAAEIAAIIVAALVVTGFATFLITRTPRFVK